MDANLEQARDFFLQGVAHYEAGRWIEAESRFAAALVLAPGRPSVLLNLGAARLKLGRFEEAAALLEQAIAADPDNAQALGHCATAWAELGDPAKALPYAERALDAEPAAPALWSLRGTLLRELGRGPEAVVAFERAIATGADPVVHRYYIASLTGTDAPRSAPREYVASLFERYADGFETHLVGVLGYRAPEILASKLRARRFRRMLDLGCGTGLCGEAMRAQCDRIDGVDLSPAMVGAARARGVYDSVGQGDVIEFLRAETAPCDLVVAADVLVYVGGLEELFTAVAARLAPGGVFAFTVELAPETEDFVLRPTMRYAHSRRYIRSLAEPNGFEFLDTAESPIRDDQRTPIPGWFAWLAKR